MGARVGLVDRSIRGWAHGVISFNFVHGGGVESEKIGINWVNLPDQRRHHHVVINPRNTKVLYVDRSKHTRRGSC